MLDILRKEKNANKYKALTKLLLFAKAKCGL